MADVNAHNARLLVIAPLRIECAAVRRGLPEALVLRSGVGAARARSTALLAARIPAAAVAVAGFCGALGGGLRAGDVVVASEVPRTWGRDAMCERAARRCTIAALGMERVHVGPLISVDRLVHGAQRGLLAGEGALAVDIGVGVVGRRRRGGRFAVLRVVLDTPARDIYRPLATLTAGRKAWQALRRAVPALAPWARA